MTDRRGEEMREAWEALVEACDQADEDAAPDCWTPMRIAHLRTLRDALADRITSTQAVKCEQCGGSGAVFVLGGRGQMEPCACPDCCCGARRREK